MKLFKYTTWRPLDRGCSLKKDCDRSADCEQKRKCYTQENLLKSSLYFNSPDNFNDPFDTKPNIDATCDLQAYKIYSNRVNMNRGMNKSKANKETNVQLRTDPILRSKAGRQQRAEEAFSEIRNTTGVCCFSLNKPSTLLMWAHYGDKHRGVCLEFDITEDDLFYCQTPSSDTEIGIAGPLPMQYSENSLLPSYHFFEEDNLEEIYKILTTKSKEWEYEKEWRALSTRYIGPLLYSPSCLKAIYAGYKMDPGNYDDLCKTIKKLHHQPILYRTDIKKDQYVLDIIKE